MHALSQHTSSTQLPLAQNPPSTGHGEPFASPPLEEVLDVLEELLEDVSEPPPKPPPAELEIDPLADEPPA